MMQYAAVIPDGDRVLRPAETALKVHPLGVVKQKFQQRLAFFLRQIVELSCPMEGLRLTLPSRWLLFVGATHQVDEKEFAIVVLIMLSTNTF